MNVVRFIEAKRDGRAHTKEELAEFCRLVGQSAIPDYQVSAWLMAAFLNPLSDEEAAWLTEGMADSGERLDLSGLPEPWVDKHSTGGVGDKTTLVVVPMLAACGLTIVKMSGRGLGITGGTIDKLESVPGFRTDLSPAELKAQAMAVGIGLGGQTANLAPADKHLYALRDVTGTTASMPLMASSILSKKLAGGAKYVVLDVKAGRGAFMTTEEGARELAKLLVRIGEGAGLHTSALISDMDVPLGSAVGNAVEVREAWDVLTGREHDGPVKRFRELCVALTAHVLTVVGEDPATAMKRAETCLTSGMAWEKAERWLIAQGAERHLILPVAPTVLTVTGTESGWVGDIHPVQISQLVLDLGGGRKTKTDQIDHRVGVELLVSVGDQVESGQPLLRIHAASESAAEEMVGRAMGAITISPSPVPARAVIRSS